MALSACRQAPSPQSAPAPPAPAAAATRAAPAAPQHLAVEGTAFHQPDGGVLQWRGVTAFRLLEMLEAGKIDEVERTLAWAALERLTVLRVLTMAKHLFALAPERGLAHLPDLLERAARQGLFVEIVALADTAEIEVDPAAHVKAVGAIAARYPNALVEIANEPYHPTQREDVRSLARLEALAALVPAPVPVAVGALDLADESRAGDYATFHFPRSVAHDGWGHVVELGAGAAAMRRMNKPLINDEPIGAGPEFQPGRRDNSPERFRAAAILSRMTGMGATFHYEGGLHGRLPEGRELEMFQAWQEAWTRLPQDIEVSGTFHVGASPASAVAKIDGTVAGAWDVHKNGETWLLLVGASAATGVQWKSGWREAEAVTWPGSQWRRAVRTSP